MPLLPPVTQDFTVNATAFLAGIDAMLAATAKLAESLNIVAESSARVSGAAADVAAADVVITDASTAADMAMKLQRDAVESLVFASEDLIKTSDAAAAAIGRETVALDAAAGAATKADESTGAFAARGKTAFLAVAAGAAFAVVEAAKFQTQVTRLYTAAGLAGVKMQQVQQDLLKLGDQVGYSGTQMAEAMYHPISAGLSYAAALQVVAYSAELARIHGADLTDTTYALSSVMKAYGLTAGDVGHTSALLNAIVGQGDMTFSDFIESVKNWTPTGAAMGISIQSMGAAIAYLTDRGNSAEVASTRLTMGLSMVTSGSKAANEYLSALGLTTGTLALRNQTLEQVMLAAGLTTNKIAADLTKPDGIYVALNQIQGAFARAGLSASQADEVMAKIFGGGRSDKAMMSLLQNLPNLALKYRDIGQAVGGYGKAWQRTQATVEQEWHRTLAGIQNLAISFGQVLLPPVEKVLAGISRLFSYLQAHPALAKVVGAIVAVAVAATALGAVLGGLGAAVEALDNPVALVIIAAAALGYELYELYKHCAAVRQAVADVANFFVGVWQSAVRGAGDVVHWFVTGPLAWIAQQLAVFTQFWAEHGQEIDKIAKVAWDYIGTTIKAAWDLIKGIVGGAVTIVVGILKAAWDIIWGITKLVWDSIATVISTVVHVVMDVVGAFLDVLQGHWSAAGHELAAAWSSLWHGIVKFTTTILGGLWHILWQAGSDLIKGLIGGIKDAVVGVWHAIDDVAHGIIHIITDVLGIFSPSRVMFQVGTNVGLGLAQGILASKAAVVSAAAQVGSAAATAMTAGLTAGFTGGASAVGRGIVDTGLLAGLNLATGISHGMMSGLGGGAGGGGGVPGALGGAVSAAATKAARLAKALHDIGLELASGFARGIGTDSASQVKSAIDKLMSLVRTAFDAGGIGYRTAHGLTDFLAADNTRLQDLAGKRTALLKTITTAEKYATTTASNVTSWAGISNVISGMPAGSVITSQGVEAGLQADLAKIQRFNNDIRRLAHLGLDKNLLNQIIQAGPDNGSQIAEALLNGPVSEIGKLNRTETAITGSARALGREAANAMYDAGKYAGHGFLSGLEHQQKAIEKLMERIAKAMIDKIRHELGIKSPSAVFHQHGLMVALGLAEGMDAGRPLVDAASKRLAHAAGFSLLPGHGGGFEGGGSVTVENHWHIGPINVPNGFVGSDAQLSAVLAEAVQKAILQQQGRNPTPQTTTRAGRR